MLAELPWLEHGFGTRTCGLRRPHPARAHGRLLQLRQVHGSLIWLDPAPGTAGDGMITARPGRLLALRTADCCPILLADTEHRAVAAVHAGWRGTLAGIAAKAVGEMRRVFSTDPAAVRAAIGPGIRACCYQVSAEVRDQFCARFSYADGLFTASPTSELALAHPALFLSGAPPGHAGNPRWAGAPGWQLDLAQANRQQLTDAGVPSASIDILPACTQCLRQYYSHRRGDQGRQLSAIGIRNSALEMPLRID
ncbi:MAG: peptidoglycan editing factor PgeF [Terriglobales bacterium]